MKSSSEMEVCVIKPSYYENTRDIIDTLLEGKVCCIKFRRNEVRPCTAYC